MKVKITDKGLPKRLYTVEEASIYLGRTVNAVRAMYWYGKLPYLKDGRTVLIDKIDMDDWIESTKMVNPAG